ncbi:Protein VAC14-like protein [Bienertia sinuspersici]
MDSKLPQIFTCNDGYSTSKGALEYLDDKDYDICHRYILEEAIQNPPSLSEVRQDDEEDENKEEEQEEEEEGEDDEEEEDNNDDGGAADNLDGITGQGITVLDDTGNPEAKLSLHPDGLWFGHRDVVDVVVETSYKTYFKGPYYNWGVTPVEHEFSSDPSIASLVKKEWQSKCAQCLSGIMSKVCTYPTYAATWCAPELRAQMKKI